jgi:hypothetical protein
LIKEENVFIARCLDLTVSSHGKNEEDALKSLADSIKEYILTALENDAIDTIFDPSHGKYWRMYNELEAKKSAGKLKRSLKMSFKSGRHDHLRNSNVEINYA